MSSMSEPERISTGSSGLDDILGGGLDRDRVYLVEGKPGSGKTTIAMQFLLEGARQGERGLYVAMSETRRELELVAKRHEWSLADVEIFENFFMSEFVPKMQNVKFHYIRLLLSLTTIALSL